MSTAKIVYWRHKLRSLVNYFKITVSAPLLIFIVGSKLPAIPIIKKLTPIITAKATRNLKKVKLNMPYIVTYQERFLKTIKNMGERFHTIDRSTY